MVQIKRYYKFKTNVELNSSKLMIALPEANIVGGLSNFSILNIYYWTSSTAATSKIAGVQHPIQDPELFCTSFPGNPYTGEISCEVYIMIGQ